MKHEMEANPFIHFCLSCVFVLSNAWNNLISCNNDNYDIPIKRPTAAELIQTWISYNNNNGHL